jgi:cereblon
VLFIALVRAPLPARWFACAKCGAKLAPESARVSIAGRPLRATYTNPMGLVCDLLTVREAVNLEAPAEFVAEHSWFEGYAWQPVVCGRCSTHVGWRYQAVRPGLEPARFFGLLAGAVRRVAEA